MAAISLKKIINEILSQIKAVDSSISTINSTADFGNANILWDSGSNGYFMVASQTVTLSQTVDSQKHGIVLAWSTYASSASQNYGWNYQFIPKWHVASHGGQGVDYIMPNTSTTSNVVCKKYFYVHNDRIVGHANNDKTGTGYANNTKVLRAVIGV